MLAYTTDRLLSLNTFVVLQMDGDTVQETTEMPSQVEPSADSKIRWVT